MVISVGLEEINGSLTSQLDFQMFIFRIDQNVIEHVRMNNPFALDASLVALR